MSPGKRGSGGVEPAVGQLRRQVVLESEAVYRICDLGPPSIEVEVVRAPGLAAGARYRFTTAAVRAMEVVEEHDGE